MDFEFPISDFTIDSIDPDLIKKCCLHDTIFPLSPSSTLVELSMPNPESTRLTENYPDAFTDTHGLHGGAPFVYKTGAAWPKVADDPGGRIFNRQLRAIGSHPIEPVWDEIISDTGAFLEQVGKTFTAVLGLSFANVGAKTAFCPLVVTIGVEPETIEFVVAKQVAEHVKTNILAKAGFDTIEVAVWEFETHFSATGLGLPSLNPDLDQTTTNLRHPFTSTLGIAIAPLKEPYYEGSIGLFMTRGDGSELLAITAAHVARPPPMFPQNLGLTEKSAEMHHEEVVILGYEAYRLAILHIEIHLGHLATSIKALELRAKDLRASLEDGEQVDSEEKERISVFTKIADQDKEILGIIMADLNSFHSKITKNMSIADARCIGHVIFADPIGASVDGYTRDWAALTIRKDAFRKDFKGNTIYMGDLDANTFLGTMFPNVTDREGYGFPKNGMLPLRGVVPESDLLHFKQLDTNGDPFLGVIKSGKTSRSTMGRVHKLKGLVRHYGDGIVDFWSWELVIFGVGGGAFSEKGDSGSVVADRCGRIVGLITSGGGTTDRTDMTFASPYCLLEKRIKEAIPGIRLVD